jgi:hypothetical protein
LLAIACLSIACSKGATGGGAGPLRQPGDLPERSTGCIDTPYLGNDPGTRTTGIVCGRARSADAGVLEGRVIEQLAGGLPGGAAEGLLVSVHVLDETPLNLDALPPARAQGTTNAQGEFSLARVLQSRVVVVVRARPGGPILAARVLERLEAPASMSLSVPASR